MDADMFPSPHGDKFQLAADYSRIGELEFPSPHGDKFQRKLDRQGR